MSSGYDDLEKVEQSESSLLNNKSKIWLVRMPGGPLKAVKSVKQPLTAEQVKVVYRRSVNCLASECDVDRELVWPELKPIDEMTLSQRYPFLIEISEVTKKPRALVEC
jgi:hypothetical protein